MSTTNTSGCNVILLVPVQLAGLSMSRLDKSTQPGVMEQILRCWESGAMTRNFNCHTNKVGAIFFVAQSSGEGNI